MKFAILILLFSSLSMAAETTKKTMSIDREAIRSVILKNIREIRSCYERELKIHPEMYGKLVLSWDIIKGGEVKSAMVKKNTLKNRNVAKCVVHRLMKWKFPNPPGDQVARVKYPFVFSTEEKKAKESRKIDSQEDSIFVGL